MITDKTIVNAARDYCNKRYPASQDAPFITEGFRKGAKWAIEHFLEELWHPAEEEPKDGSTVLIIGEERSANVYLIDSGYPDWDDEVRMWNITQWCYLDDILPKKGGEG